VTLAWVLHYQSRISRIWLAHMLWLARMLWLAHLTITRLWLANIYHTVIIITLPSHTTLWHDSRTRHYHSRMSRIWLAHMSWVLRLMCERRWRNDRDEAYKVICSSHDCCDHTKDSQADFSRIESGVCGAQRCTLGRPACAFYLRVIHIHRSLQMRIACVYMYIYVVYVYIYVFI